MRGFAYADLMYFDTTIVTSWGVDAGVGRPFLHRRRHFVIERGRMWLAWDLCMSEHVLFHQILMIDMLGRSGHAPRLAVPEQRKVEIAVAHEDVAAIDGARCPD